MTGRSHLARALRALPAALYTAGIFYAGTIRLRGLPSGFGLDKVFHFVSFAGLALLIEFALIEAGPRLAAVLSVVLASAVGLALELVQAALPHRSAEVLDWVADTLGALLGAWIWAAFSARRAAQARGR
jgi:VanZ family protein